ncbi:hypothetical protein HMPREF1985_02108 [Mitsuokella sp. oral taxon 131 str. W9106]|nr:hypothetical protein HMPREF1985_02108 [Mitsuokella sp. oral taxon 131 str. W9106]
MHSGSFRAFGANGRRTGPYDKNRRRRAGPSVATTQPNAVFPIFLLDRRKTCTPKGRSAGILCIT